MDGSGTQDCHKPVIPGLVSGRREDPEFKVIFQPPVESEGSPSHMRPRLEKETKLLAHYKRRAEA